MESKQNLNSVPLSFLVLQSASVPNSEPQVERLVQLTQVTVEGLLRLSWLKMSYIDVIDSANQAADNETQNVIIVRGKTGLPVPMPVISRSPSVET